MQQITKRSQLYSLAASLSLTMTLLAAGCGKGDEEKQAPPPTTGGDKSAKAFALTSGENYRFSTIDNLRDGCGKNPLPASGRRLTDTPFVLTNDGAGGVTIDLCSGGLGGVTGAINGNKGLLRVMHSRLSRSGDAEATYDQSCTVSLTVTANDSFSGTFQETQTNRNLGMQVATGIDATECTTTFDFKMTKTAAP